MIEVRDVKRGDHVLIKKGTLVTNRRKAKPAGKDYMVKVRNVFTGHKITAHEALNDKDYCYRLEELGIDEAALRALRVTDEDAFYERRDIVVRKASLSWAGTGGYWSEANLEDIDVVIRAIPEAK